MAASTHGKCNLYTYVSITTVINYGITNVCAHVHEISRASSVREAGMAYVVLIEQALLIIVVT